MTEQTEAPMVRQQSFEVDGPIEVDIGIGAGRIEVRLIDDARTADVEVRHDPSASSPWMQGMSSLLNWVSQFGADPSVEMSPDEAVRQTRIDQSGGRLVVR